MLNLILAGIGAFLIGLSKAGFATGIGILATPMLALTLPARQALGVILPLIFFADLWTISLYWKKWDFRIVFPILTGAVPGIITGTMFLGVLSDRHLELFIGFITIIFVGLLIIKEGWFPEKKYVPPIWHSFLIGCIAGWTSATSHAAAPIIAIFLLAQKVEKVKFVATIAIYFAFGNLIKIPSYIISKILNWDLFIKSLYYMPLIPLGVIIGWWLNRFISPKIFNRIAYVLLLATAIGLII
jgi:uncharacterized membrane protein YfcA